MKTLTIMRRITFVLLSMLLSVTTWGQSSLSLLDPTEPNSETNPYLIGSAADWAVFASNSDYWDDYVKLTSNIPNAEEVAAGTTFVSEMLYADEGYTAFTGNFNGNNKTLTFSYTAADEYDTGIAPFYYIDGATVKNLTIDGAINAKAGMVAGLAIYNYNGTINNVTIGLDIIAEEQYWCGGFAYESDGENYTNCIYNGKIVAGAQSCGFTVTVTYGGAEPVFDNCLFDPKEGSSIKNGKVFGDGSNFSKCYYTDNLGITSQGTKVYKNPTDFVGKKVSAFPDYCTPVNVVVTGVNLTYDYNNETNYYIGIMSAVTVTSDDPSLTYNVSIHDKDGATETVTDKGDYAVVVTGTGNYTGSFKKYFYVVGDIELQNPESPYNETTNPYVITSAADWIKLSDNVSQGINDDKSYKLTADIAVTDMVGTSSHPFSGHFSGREGNTYNIHTLTFTRGTSETPIDEQIVAPFRYTDGATIEYLKVSGAIHTNVGKEAGLIGVNTNTTNVRYVIVDLGLYCYEDLWDEEGGGFAYDGRGIQFNSCAYQGLISAENYHGGFCGNADQTTTFTECLFNPADGGIYWAENFVWNNNGATIGNTCYYTEGNNQEESEQGRLVYVVYAEHSLPNEIIGKKVTTLYGRGIYEPVNVVISGVKKRYIYNNDSELLNINSPSIGVTFDGQDALTNNWCSKKIINKETLDEVESIKNEGTYKFIVTATKTEGTPAFLGSVTQLIRVVKVNDSKWRALQAQLSGDPSVITVKLSELGGDISAFGDQNGCLVVESGKKVTINLDGYKIDRGFYDEDNEEWGTPVAGGHVLKVLSGATVTIVGPGTIMGGANKGASNVEHGENNDGGGIYNMGTLTLDNVTVQGNYCEKFSTTTSRTARGGGIYSGKNSTLIVNNCTITHNEAKGGGGGIYAEQAAVFMMDNTNVRSNKSQDKGGGVRVDATNTKHNVADGKALADGALLKDCQISSNTVVFHSLQSASNGGGIHLDAGTLNLTGCTINNNNSSKYGGGIYMMGGTVNADNCQILYNKSYDSSDKFEGYGGGVCVLNGTYNMNGGRVYENSSYKQNGGGIFVAAGKTLNISGNVNITANWTDEESLSSKHTSNVYLVGSNDKIHITGSIEGSTIGVAKSGTTGRFTQGLSGNGTTNNFISDNTDYEILPDSGEAKIGAATPVTPPTTGTWIITDAVILTSTVSSDVKYITFGEDGRLYVNTGGSIGSGTQITNTDPNKLIIKGGQVYTTISGVYATMLKDINYASTSGEYPDNWYLISSGIATPNILDNTNLVVVNGNNYPLYDLYRFNEAVDLQWENYRANHGDFTLLQNGRGYLYRNYNDYTISMQGTLNAAGFDYLLSYSGTNELKGFHILGNPYSHDIYKGSAESAIPNGSLLNSKYYVLNPSGSTWDLTNDGTAIPPMTGILVQAKEQTGENPNYTLTIANSTNGYVAPTKGSSDNKNIWFTITNNKYEDKTCVEFREGRGLNKIAHINEEAPMLYINRNGEKFASADLGENAQAFNLNFEAKATGMFTLSCKANGDFSYLHLFDKVAGRDIDMLLDGEYTFIGSPTDGADRFIVRLSETTTDSNGNTIFAYQNGDDIIVNGNGELQIFDMMGRLIATQRVTGVETVEKPSANGVYILRLNEMSQKIVVK